MGRATFRLAPPYPIHMRLLLLILSLSLLAPAQIKLSVDQLTSFLKSSVRLKHPDQQVATYLKKVTLTEKLTPAKLEVFLAEGIGPKTYDQLQALVAATAALPTAKEAAVAAVKATAPNIPPPSDTEQRKLVSELREYALNYDKNLPDFLCTHVTRRFYDPSGLEYWLAADTVTAKLSYFQHKEEKKILFVNNKYQDIDWEKLGGASSTGEFGAMLREIFLPETQATFQWERWGTLRGKRNHVIRYMVEQPRSTWSIVYEKSQMVRPAYTGFIYAEADTGLVTRLVLNAIDIPASFPIQQAKTVLDYDYADINGATFLLPLRAEVRMREGKLLIRNDIEFRNYRKFGADTSITFEGADSTIKYETPDPISADKLDETPVQKPTAKPAAPSAPATPGVKESTVPKENGSKPSKP